MRIQLLYRSSLFFAATAVVALLVSSSMSSAAPAEVIPGKVIVRGVQGLVSYSDEDGQGQPLKAETVLHPGAVIQTASSGMAEIALDGGAGVVRLGPNTSIVLQKLNEDRAHGEVVDIQLTLQSGAVIGRTEKLRPGSNFEIKTAAGIAGVRQGLYRVSSDGKVEVAEGLVAFAATSGGSAPVTNMLQTPPAKMFTPGEGLKDAPAGLAAELSSQLAAKFKKR